MNKRIVEIIITIVIIAIAGVIWINREEAKRNVIGDYKKTTGQIVEYYLIGIHKTRYLKYKYTVDNKEYYRKINCSVSFDQCEKRIQFCNDKLFFVIYNSKNPEESLIDLTNEIQGVDNPIFPKNLERFE